MASAAKRFEVVSGTAAPQIAFDGATLVLGGKTIIENLSSSLASPAAASPTP